MSRSYWHIIHVDTNLKIDHMTKTAKILSTYSIVAYLIGIFYIYAFRGGEYDWMVEMTPEIVNAPQSSDDWIFLSQCALIFTLASQTPALFLKNRKYHMAMMVLAIILHTWSENH